MGDSFSNKNVSEIINDEYYKKIFNKENIVISKIGDEKLKLEDDLLEKVCKSIGDGKVIGWFYGAMEWGPELLDIDLF